MHVSRERPDLLLGEAGLDQGAPHSVPFGGVQTGTKVALVVHVCSVGHPLVPVFGGEAFQVRVQLVFAEEAAVRVVGLVVRSLDLVGLDDAMVQPQSLGYVGSIPELGGREAWGLGGDCQSAVPEHIVGGGGQE